MKLPPLVCVACVMTALALSSKVCAAGADETTPSKSQYFSWINHTNEGPTEAQTLANFEFFAWLRDEYGMQLDIYAFDAGAIDGARFYGSTRSERFQRQFPRGFGPLAEAAAAMGTRLGIWGGPDGFGDTPEEEAARIEQTVSLCRDFNFALFKMDAVCGQLRPEKYAAFDRMMELCRVHTPDLILLNHRLDLGPGTKHSTTYLLGGAETYIGVHMANEVTATHNRAVALSRELPPGLTRLTEDHGVCLSSCLDYWEDDLVLQAFNRSLILAPQIYGNPWLLADDEYPRLAYIFNLHRRYRDILVNGIELPAAQYGPGSVSRGDESTRLLTLRNLSWEPLTYTIALDETTGLAPSPNRVRVSQLHPWNLHLGDHEHGGTVTIEVQPFRSCLLRLSTDSVDPWELEGAAYEVVRDVPGKPVEIRLLGEPAEQATLLLRSGKRSFSAATMDGEEVNALVRGEGIDVTFDGTPRRAPAHRRLARLEPRDVPDDAEGLYEATCYAADNNALELRSLRRSGPTRIPAVQRARDAFFDQPLFVSRGISDRFLFDDDRTTEFSVNLRWGDTRVKGGAFRLDLGEVQRIDELVLETTDEFGLQPLKSEEGVIAQVSADLVTWHEVTFLAGVVMQADLRQLPPWRYLRFSPAPLRLLEVYALRDGEPVDRSEWRASNLFSPYVTHHWSEQSIHRARKAWSARFTLEELPRNGYLCVAVNGEHGVEGAVAAFRIGGRLVGCPDRSPSFPSNTWEVRARPTGSNNTFYLPLTPDMVGQEMEAYVLAFDPTKLDLQPEVWVTAYPAPFESRTLVLHE